MNAVHVGVVVVLVGVEGLMTGLAILNRRYEERILPEERAWVEAELGIEDADEVLTYQRATTGAALLRSWVLLGGLLLVVYAGIYGDIVAALQHTGLSPTLQGVLLVAGALAAYRLASIPFDLFDTFVVEEQFGFNNQTPSLWLRDLFVGTTVMFALSLPIAGALFWIIEHVSLWWAAGWVLAVLVLIALQVLLPRVVYPLFYEFTPVEESDLREAVDAVFERAGFTCDQVYEMDASRRSSHSNAFFTGFGRTKRVVLFDTLVDGMEVPEIQSVLAHELAHWKYGHIWKFLALGAVQFLVVFAALGALVEWSLLYTAFAIPPDATYAGFVLALVIVSHLYQVTSPLTNVVSLRFERQADRFAVETVGSEPLARALAELAAENLAELFPHPWYERFHYDHPPFPERIRDVRALGDGAEPAGGVTGEAPTGSTGGAE